MLKETVGTTFSPIQCEYLGIDYKNAFRRILDLGPSCVRIAAYGNRGYAESDFLVEEAGKKGVWMILAVGGVKYPRWPEFFPDEELAALMAKYPEKTLGKNPYVKDAIKNRLVTNVERYKKAPNAKIFQVENEARHRMFFSNFVCLAQQLLHEEIDLTYSIKRPDQLVMLTNAIDIWTPFWFYDKHLLRESANLADVVGIDIHPTVALPRPLPGYLTASFLSWRKIKEAKLLVEQLQKIVLAAEVKMEPWENYEINDPHRKNYGSMRPEEITVIDARLSQMGFTKRITWGSEFAVFKNIHGDPRWLRAHEQIYQTAA